MGASRTQSRYPSAAVRTAVSNALRALSICALPPFSGFASEWLLLQGLLRGFSAHGAATATVLLVGVAALALTGGLTAAAFVKAFGIGFLGQPRTPAAAAAAEADAPLLAFRAGCSKVAGMFSTVHRLGGQTIQNARPTTMFSGIVPPPG